MTLEQVIANLDLPDGARVDRRVAKKLVAEYSPRHRGKAIRQGIERLRWIAALKPGNCAIPAGVIPQAVLDKPVGETFPVEEVSVLTLEARSDAHLPTVVKAIHEAIPYLVLLLTTQENRLHISLAWKRPSLSQQAKSVLLVGLQDAQPVDLTAPEPLQSALLDALAVGAPPVRDLAALYRRWAAALLAARVATVTGTFELVQDADSLESRQALLDEYGRLSKEIPRLTREFKRATQLRDRVELSTKIKCVEAELARVAARLNESH